MHTATLNTPRTAQSAAPSTQALTPNEGVNTEPKLVLMSWAEWAATPKDYRLTSLYGRAGRWVMRAGPQGVTLYPVHITG
ncbi:hypothetical protein [Thiomonas arsenitoxydans]|uniref:Uncharacterized protein n=1 Tax=Thiomonas arsenitoxydans (strain DSM 22701 / CIP 110005 / 3As) TaxID=426114 RepID=D6CTU3_THIA3|nr:hypothetical protein [Thiomonas arsenitoxydans]CAZ88712.1 hypothetical protein THI_2055 [Thiomonas arsenitoxydans]